MIKEIKDIDIISKKKSYYLNSKRGLLIVKADWCGHCRRALTELEEVSKLMGNMFPIYKLDADLNQSSVDLLGVTGYPTIFFVEEDGRISNQYNKERKSRVIIDEICSVMKKCF